MTENSKIEWTDHTFNPWEGCTKIGLGCDRCYAEARNNRFKGGNWGSGAPRRRTSDANWRLPLKWNREAESLGIRYRVFCASLADVFDNEVDPSWRGDLFELIKMTPNLDWLLLTKRIGNAASMLPADWGNGWDNVWLGATVVNQMEVDRDIIKLLNTPAKLRFLSIEPLLGKIDLLYPESIYPGGHSMCCSGHEYGCMGRPVDPPILYHIDWVIVGGESGPGARPMHPDWARSLRDQCESVNVPFLFKQWGEWKPADVYGSGENSFIVVGDCKFSEKSWDTFSDGQVVARIGKKASGRKLDGIEHNEFPVPCQNIRFGQN